MDNWDTAARLTLQFNGGTFTPDGEQVFAGIGYYVGGVVNPARMKASDGGRGVLADVLRTFSRTHAERFAHNEHRYIGTWIDGGVVYVDVTEWVGDKAVALGLARERGELAVWDCQRGIPVYL